jgi:hypothetical protein
VWDDPDVDPVITMIAEACEGGRLDAAYQTLLGADELDRREWRKPHWRNYFASGTIDLDLPYLDGQLRPIVDGRTVRCPGRELYIRKDSLERFLAELKEPQRKASQPQRVPAKQRAAREAIAACFPGGVPTDVEMPNGRLCATVAAWLKTHRPAVAGMNDRTILRAAGRAQ